MPIPNFQNFLSAHNYWAVNKIKYYTLQRLTNAFILL